MTLILSAHGEKFIVLGSDTRGTDQWEDGSRVEVNVVRKVWPAGKHIQIMLCGEGDYAFNLYDIFRTRHGVNHMDVRDAANHLADVAREDARGLRNVPGAFESSSGVGFIVAGLDILDSGPRPISFRVASESGYKLELMQLGYCIDGKANIPKYLFAKHFRPGMQLDDLARLAAHAVYEVGSVDSDVGGHVEVHVIDSTGTRSLSPTAVRLMLADPLLRPPEPEAPIEPGVPIGVPPAPPAKPPPALAVRRVAKPRARSSR